MDEPIQIMLYDPSWPARFEDERAALAQAIGHWIVGGIHHVGSTAVRGLAAKPIIDILVGVRSLERSRDCFERLAGLGYLYAPYLPDEMHWFCNPTQRIGPITFISFRSARDATSMSSLSATAYESIRR